MDMRFITLRKQLDELGYKECLTLDCLPLVERITGDLLQTTRSLQHYMNLSKETLQERDALKSVADPYICDNTKLVRENNKLHREILSVTEDFEASLRRAKTKIRKLENSVSSLEFQNRNLKMRCRDNELRNIRADTFSSRSKQVTGYSRQCCARQTINSQAPEPCTCDKMQCCICMQLQDQLDDANKKFIDCDTKNGELDDEIIILQNQLANRDKDIHRLRLMLEGGRPFSALQKDCCGKDLDRKMMRMKEEIEEYDQKIQSLSSQLKDALDKQQEAMDRATKLAEKNNSLVKELQNIDQLALRIETESNDNLKERSQIIMKLETQLETVQKKFKKMEEETENIRDENRVMQAEQEALKNENHALSLALESQTEIKERLVKENETLLRLNQRKPRSIHTASNDYLLSSRLSQNTSAKDRSTKEELLQLLEKERQIYEAQINDVKKQLADVNRIQSSYAKAETHCTSCDKLRYERDILLQKKSYTSDDFVADLKNKICELEQHVQCLKKQNDILNENNSSLKLCLEQNNSSRQRKHSHSPDLDNYLHQTIGRLERELKRSVSNIQCLEEENNILKSKLRMANYRDLHSPPIVTENRFYDRHPITNVLKQENEILLEKLKTLETELLHVKSVNSQLKTLQMENDKNISSSQAKFYEAQREIQIMKEHVKALEKVRFDLEHECQLHKSDKISLRDNISKIDQERDKIIMEIDDKTEKIASMEHEFRSKNTNIEMLENRVKELNKKLDLINSSNSAFEHRWRDSQTRNEALSSELDSIVKQRDSALIENKRLQSDLAALSNDLRSVNIEYERSRKDVEQMKQQLQHYVDEVRRIEDILSRKEAERTEIFNQFANLSHEATVLETNNHSLESETASKSIQLQVSADRIGELEKKLESRESLVDMQEEKIAKLIFTISKLESELTQQKELTNMAEKNLEFARETCITLEKQKKSILLGMGDTDTEKRKLEYDLRLMKDEKSKLEGSYVKDRATVESLEALLNSSRREVVELKLKLQEALEETKLLREKVDQLQERLRKVEGESFSSRQRTEEAAKNLQELQWQINDERFKRAHLSEPQHQKIFHQHTSTL